MLANVSCVTFILCSSASGVCGRVSFSWSYQLRVFVDYTRVASAMRFSSSIRMASCRTSSVSEVERFARLIMFARSDLVDLVVFPWCLCFCHEYAGFAVIFLLFCFFLRSWGLLFWKWNGFSLLCLRLKKKPLNVFSTERSRESPPELTKELLLESQALCRMATLSPGVAEQPEHGTCVPSRIFCTFLL